MKNTKVYILGKITGLDYKVAYGNFEMVEKALKAKGFAVVNPMKLPHNHDKSWESYMKECIPQLVQCDLVYKLDNWQQSKGARLEQAIAYNLKIKEIKI